MKIVYVHGIAQEQRSAAELQVEWDAALKTSLAKASLAWPGAASSVVPFYGRILADRTAEVDKQAAHGLIPRGGSESEDQEMLAFYEAFLTEIATARNVDLTRLVGADGRPVARGVQNHPWVVALLRRLNKFGPVAGWSIDTFTRDAWAYLCYLTVREPIHVIVEAEIPRDEPCVVVAHSLGSVVAYNVLHQRAAGSNVRALVTLGSPLGLQSVYDRLPSAKGKRTVPRDIGEWYNARDPVDIVALHEVPADRFTGEPRVENASHVANGTGNHHGIRGYLSDAEIARRIHAAAMR
jgi:hypothetical protein